MRAVRVDEANHLEVAADDLPVGIKVVLVEQLSAYQLLRIGGYTMRQS